MRSRSALSVKRRRAIPQWAGKRAFNRAKTCCPSLTRPVARSSSPACKSRCNAASLSASVSAGSTVTAKRASAAGGSGNRSRIRFGSSEAETSIVNGSRNFADLRDTRGFLKYGRRINTRPPTHSARLWSALIARASGVVTSPVGRKVLSVRQQPSRPGYCARQTGPVAPRCRTQERATMILVPR